MADTLSAGGWLALGVGIGYLASVVTFLAAPVYRAAPRQDRELVAPRQPGPDRLVSSWPRHTSEELDELRDVWPKPERQDDTTTYYRGPPPQTSTPT